jgi:putative transposase
VPVREDATGLPAMTENALHAAKCTGNRTKSPNLYLWLYIQKETPVWTVISFASGSHVVFIPKCRRKTLYAQLRRHLGEVFRRLAEQKESTIEEGHLMPDHVHMMISIPPKYAVSQVIGFIKGKSAIHLARVYGETRRNFVGQSFWARGYFVSTVGRDEEVIRNYIRNQEEEDQRLDQMNLWR